MGHFDGPWSKHQAAISLNPPPPRPTITNPTTVSLEQPLLIHPASKGRPHRDPQNSRDHQCIAPRQRNELPHGQSHLKHLPQGFRRHSSAHVQRIAVDEGPPTPQTSARWSSPVPSLLLIEAVDVGVRGASLRLRPADGEDVLRVGVDGGRARSFPVHQVAGRVEAGVTVGRCDAGAVRDTQV